MTKKQTIEKLPTTDEKTPPRCLSGNPIFWLFLFTLLIGAGIIGYWLGQNYSLVKTKQSNNQEDLRKKPMEQAVGDSMENPTRPPRPTLQTNTEPTPTLSLLPDENSLEDTLKQLFAEKFDKDIDDIILTIGEQQPSHARGGVKFEGEIGGGWFLAAEVGGTWLIVQDGNGTMSCEITDPYDFPVSMVPECVDSGGNLITK